MDFNKPIFVFDDEQSSVSWFSLEITPDGDAVWAETCTSQYALWRRNIDMPDADLAAILADLEASVAVNRSTTEALSEDGMWLAVIFEDKDREWLAPRWRVLGYDEVEKALPREREKYANYKRLRAEGLSHEEAYAAA